MESASQSYQFSADIDRLFDIIVNNFYSKKEVFLRELVSNASDALEKVRMKMLTNDQVSEKDNLKIEVRANADDLILSINDNGIGMDKSELVDILGKIANSGTKDMLKNLEQDGNVNNDLIGQFGMGFYSAFLVSHKVEVDTKKDGCQAYKWSSNADGRFTISSSSKDTRGTVITLNLKEDAVEFLEQERLSDIIKKHSSYINFPIYLWSTKEETVEVEEDKEDEDEEDDETVEIEEVDDKEENEEQKEKKTETKTVTYWDHINDNEPIWNLSTDKVTDEQYETLYKSICNDYSGYMDKVHFKLEGNVVFKAILYIPEKQPHDLFTSAKKVNNRIKLYVRKVFVDENLEDLVPEWLNFVTGVVDCHSLPMNVSREMLQQNHYLKAIRKQLIKKVLVMLNKSSKDEEKFNKFWEGFSKNIKYGIHLDKSYHDKLLPLLRFRTNKQDNLIGLDKYLEEMNENQKSIYYLTGSKLSEMKNSSLLSRVGDYQVVLFNEPIDEYMVQALSEYKEKKFIDISKDDLNLPKLDEKEEEKQDDQLEQFKTFIKETLGPKVTTVNFNKKLNTSCIVLASQFGWNANMERIMKAQALGQENPMAQFMMGQKVLEMNPENKLVANLIKRYNTNQDDTNIGFVKNIINLMYDTALLKSGYTLENISEYIQKIENMIGLNLSLENESIVEESTDNNLEEGSTDNNLEDVD